VACSINNFDHNEFTFGAVGGTEYNISVDGFHFAAGTASGKYRLAGYFNGLENLSLKTVGPPNPSGFPLQAQGVTGMKFALQHSTNLIDWVSVSTNTFLTPVIDLSDSTVQTDPFRFYRIMLLP